MTDISLTVSIGNVILRPERDLLNDLSYESFFKKSHNFQDHSDLSGLCLHHQGLLLVIGV